MARAIISPHFCSPYPVDLRIVKEFNSDNFSVKLANGDTVFRVLEGPLFSLHRVLTDASRYPIVTLRKKFMTLHQTWEVYRGDGKDPRNLIFRVKKSSVVQLFKRTLHVFLANNNGGDSSPDFKVKGNWLEDSCVVYAGKSKSSNIVAQMEKKETITSRCFGKDNYRVRVYPGVDQAFIVALIFILHETNSGGGDSGGGDND